MDEKRIEKEGEEMSEEKEFEVWLEDVFSWKEILSAFLSYRNLAHDAWLEKGKRDREKVMQAVDHVLTYGLPYLAEKRLRELLEEMK